MEVIQNQSSQLYSIFDSDPEPIVDFVQWLKDSYNLSPAQGVTILDVGCGPGRMLPAYARLGWQVVGMEPNPDFYRQATHVAETRPNIEVWFGGFHDIKEREVFEVITGVNGSFAYLLCRDEQLDALQRAFKALKAGGILFLDLPNLLWFLQNDPEPPPQKEVVDGQEVWLIQRHNYDLHQATFTQTNKYVVKTSTGNVTRHYEVHRHAIVSYRELAHLLEKCGFCNLRTYNSFDSRKSERLTSKRIMVSAQKPVCSQKKLFYGEVL